MGKKKYDGQPDQANQKHTPTPQPPKPYRSDAPKPPKKSGQTDNRRRER